MSPLDIIEGIEQKISVPGGYDYIMMHEGLQIVDKVIGALMGILIVIAIAGIPIIVALEVMYINNPLLRNTADTITGSKKKGVRIIALCLRDALRAIQLANTVETGKSVNAVYFGIKLKKIIIAYVIIGMALGPVNLLLAYIGKIVNSFLSLF